MRIILRRLNLAKDIKLESFSWDPEFELATIFADVGADESMVLEWNSLSQSFEYDMITYLQFPDLKL